LFLPESWSEDRDRCRGAGIPEEIVYRPKWQIALEQYDRAEANGVDFEWLTFDEGYGAKTPFLRALDAREQRYVGEVPVNLTGWLDMPKVTSRRTQKTGRPCNVPRLTKNSPRPRRIDLLLNEHPVLANQPWQPYRVKDGDKGPMVWEVKHARLIRPDSKGLPAETLHLLVARNVLAQDEVKFFFSNAPENTTVGQMLLIAFSRWRVERCFQDQKQDIGLDAWEGRRYIGLKRHLILSSVSYLFLARVRDKLREKKLRIDRIPSPRRRVRSGAKLVAQRSRICGTAGAHRKHDRVHATT
jgi:SRSO17 transposase